jgi:hypothetical protein
MASELPVDAEGQITDFPSETTTYNLRVVRNGGEETRQLTVYVDPVAGLPQIAYFDVSPEAGVTVGQCVTLAWSVSADAEFVSIFSNKEVLWDVAPLEGTLEVWSNMQLAPATVQGPTMPWTSWSSARPARRVTRPRPQRRRPAPPSPALASRRRK